MRVNAALQGFDPFGLQSLTQEPKAVPGGTGSVYQLVSSLVASANQLGEIPGIEPGSNSLAMIDPGEVIFTGAMIFAQLPESMPSPAGAPYQAQH